MPIIKSHGKFKYGKSGKAYPTKAGALRQMRVIKASQAKVKWRKI